MPDLSNILSKFFQDKGNVVDLILLDFNKVLNMLHEKLAAELEKMGIDTTVK